MFQPPSAVLSCGVVLSPFGAIGMRLYLERSCKNHSWNRSGKTPGSICLLLVAHQCLVTT